MAILNVGRDKVERKYSATVCKSNSGMNPINNSSLFERRVKEGEKREITFNTSCKFFAFRKIKVFFHRLSSWGLFYILYIITHFCIGIHVLQGSLQISTCNRIFWG